MLTFMNASPSVMVGLVGFSSIGLAMGASDTLNETDSSESDEKNEPDFSKLDQKIIDELIDSQKEKNKETVRKFIEGCPEDFQILNKAWKLWGDEGCKALSKHAMKLLSGNMMGNTQEFLESLKSFETAASNMKLAQIEMTNCQSNNSKWVFRETPDIKDYYIFGEQVGKGGFGTVNKAKCRADGKIYAVKTIMKTSIKSRKVKKEIRQRYFKDLRQEVRMLVRVQHGGHPNIIEFKEIFEDKDKLHFVMEYCSGGELFDHIPYHKGIDEDKARELLKQMFSAVEHIHDLNIGHFDLKPENFIFKTEARENIKMIDFGLARILKRGEFIDQKCGTPHYMGPEVWFDKFDKRADMWSMGTIAFTMIYGLSLFTDDGKGLAQNIVNGFIPEVREHYGPWFPQSLERSKKVKDLISKCLRYDHKKAMDMKSSLAGCEDRLSATEARNHEWFKLPGKDVKAEKGAGKSDFVLDPISEELESDAKENSDPHSSEENVIDSEGGNQVRRRIRRRLFLAHCA